MSATDVEDLQEYDQENKRSFHSNIWKCFYYNQIVNNIKHSTERGKTPMNSV